MSLQALYDALRAEPAREGWTPWKPYGNLLRTWRRTDRRVAMIFAPGFIVRVYDRADPSKPFLPDTHYKILEEAYAAAEFWLEEGRE